MWWVNKNGNIEGPFTAEQLAKRVKLNILRSLDRISTDKSNWSFVKDSSFWRPAKPTQVNRPSQLMKPDHDRRSVTSDADFADSGQPSSGKHNPSRPINARFRLGAPTVRPQSNKFLWIALVTITLFVLAGFASMAYFFLRTKDSNAYASDDGDVSKPGNYDRNLQKFDFNSVKDKLVIIECKEGGSGSGFLLEMEGKVFLMTNEHVIRSEAHPQARLLDGTSLELGAFSVAMDRDLARFEVIGCSVEPFNISDMTPNAGDMVAVYGNSLGGGVATESKGFIQEVGPNKLEANTEIVPGNSGSPLVGTDGKVIGVAAYIECRGSDEWTVKNTRYEGNPRRFAIRFNNVRWKKINRYHYERQISKLNEFKAYWSFLEPYLVFDSVDIPENLLVFKDMDRKVFKHKDYGYEEMLVLLTKAYEKRQKSIGQWLDRCKARGEFIQKLIDKKFSEDECRRAVDEYDRKTGVMFEKVKEAFRNMILKRKEALMNARSILDNEAWDAPQVLSGYSRDDRKGSVEWYLEGVQFFTDLMNQKLKDLNKEIEAIEKGEDDEED